MKNKEFGITLQVDSWAVLQREAAAVRQAVFCVEQGIPAELEWDEQDAVCLHAVARNAAGEAIGTGRLLPDGHIGRMAVLAPYRSTGVGGRILETLVDRAATRGDAAVVLHAQSYVVPFYEAHGFACEGEEFIEADIPHRTMRRALTA